MLGIPVGWLYANAGEWFIHKYILHGRGRHRDSFWAFHWHDHHQAARKNEMFDPQYTRPLWGWGPETKEVVSLVVLGVAHLPLLPLAPFFTLTALGCMANYYRVHRKAHLEPAWAKAHLPWHVDHHLGKDQNLNWCVTHPFFDWVMGTRAARISDAPREVAASRQTAPASTSAA